MFCHKCGTELPDDSQFCRKCGHAMTATSTGSRTPASAPPRPKSGIAVWILLSLLLIIIVVVWVARNSNQERGASSPAIPFIKLPQTDTITNTALTVNALGYSYFRFVVPPGATEPRVDGHFSATGGSGNDIEVYVLDADEFVNFQNRHSTNTYTTPAK